MINMSLQKFVIRIWNCEFIIILVFLCLCQNCPVKNELKFPPYRPLLPFLPKNISVSLFLSAFFGTVSLVISISDYTQSDFQQLDGIENNVINMLGTSIWNEKLVHTTSNLYQACNIYLLSIIFDDFSNFVNKQIK